MYSACCWKEEAPKDKKQGAVQVLSNAWANQHFLPAYSQYKYNLPGSFCLCIFPIMIRVVMEWYMENMLIQELGKSCSDLGRREMLD